MFTVQLPKHLEKRLAVLSDKTKRTKSFFVKQALEQFLEDFEDAHAADAAYEEFLAGGKKTIPLEKVMKQYGMET